MDTHPAPNHERGYDHFTTNDHQPQGNGNQMEEIRINVEFDQLGLSPDYEEFTEFGPYRSGYRSDDASSASGSPAVSFRSLSPALSQNAASSPNLEELDDLHVGQGHTIHTRHSWSGTLSDGFLSPFNNFRHSQSNESLHSDNTSNSSLCPSMSSGSYQGSLNSENPGTHLEAFMTTPLSTRLSQSYVTVVSSGTPSSIPIGLDPNVTYTECVQFAPSFLSPQPTRPILSASLRSRQATVEDMVNLLHAATIPITSNDPEEIMQMFIACLSERQTFGSMKPKQKVCTQASQAASMVRRKSMATFFCLLESCRDGFTRKNGLLNHYRAHLKIRDKQCDYCLRSFTTCLARHIKTCKSNPNLHSTRLPTER